MSNYINNITLGDCRQHLKSIEDGSVHLLLSDIPYGINLDEWDVLHNNTNSALLGQSPAQNGKSGFKKRGKPINGWNDADKQIGKEYEKWVKTWSDDVFQNMKEGGSVFIFGARRTLHRAINAFEDSGFLLRDVLAWKKKAAHHRAQRISIVFDRRGQEELAEEWEGWRLGNLAPIYEPIAWFFKPYKHTVTDNVIAHGVGALNIDGTKQIYGNATNLLEFGFRKNENKFHEAQKPLDLLEYLIRLTTKEGQVVLDPFMGSGSTAVAAKLLNRHFIGFEIDKNYHTQSLERLANCHKEQVRQKSLL